MSIPDEPPDAAFGPVPTRELLSFRVAGTEFAFDVGNLCEVVELVEIARVRPDDPASEGLINYRGTVIPVVDVRRALGYEPTSLGADAHIVVTDVGDEQAGLIVDEVGDVLSVPQQSIDPPSVRMPLGRFVSGIAKLEARLLLVLDIERLLAPVGPTEHRAAAAGPAAVADTAAVRDVLRRRALELSRPVDPVGEAAGAKVTAVCFGMRDGTYAIRAEFAKEIVLPPKVTAIPCTPAYVLGAVNIRGAIVPVLALAELLGATAAPETAEEQARIIVVEAGGATLGLFVNEVLGVYEIFVDDLAPPLDSLEGPAMSFIEAEFDHDGRVFCVIDVTAIVRALPGRDTCEQAPTVGLATTPGPGEGEPQLLR